MTSLIKRLITTLPDLHNTFLRFDIFLRYYPYKYSLPCKMLYEANVHLLKRYVKDHKPLSMLLFTPLNSVLHTYNDQWLHISQTQCICPFYSLLVKHHRCISNVRGKRHTTVAVRHGGQATHFLSIKLLLFHTSTISLRDTRFSCDCSTSRARTCQWPRSSSS